MLKTLIFSLAALIVVLMSNVQTGRAEDSDTLWTKDLFGSGFVINALFSPDDKTIFVSTTEKFFELDALSGNIIREIPGIRGIERFIDDFKYFISYDFKKYSFPEMALIKEYNFLKDMLLLKSYDFNKEGSIAIYINSIIYEEPESYPMSIFDANTDELLFRFKSQESFHQIKISPDGKTFVTTSSDLVDIPNSNDDITYLRVWDVSTFKEIKKIEIGEIGLGSQKFSPDGNYYSINGGSYIYLYDTKTWDLVDTFKTIDYANIISFAFSFDSKEIFLGGENIEIELFDITNNKFIKKFNPKLYPKSINLSNLGDLFASYSNFKFRLFKIRTTGLGLDNLFSNNITPNPVKGILTINNIQFDNYDMEIYDIISNIMFNKIGIVNQNSTFSIDVNFLPSGVYILKLKSNGKEINTKFIKE